MISDAWMWGYLDLESEIWYVQRGHSVNFLSQWPGNHLSNSGYSGCFYM